MVTEQAYGYDSASGDPYPDLSSAPPAWGTGAWFRYREHQIDRSYGKPEGYTEYHSAGVRHAFVGDAVVPNLGDGPAGSSGGSESASSDSSGPGGVGTGNLSNLLGALKGISATTFPAVALYEAVKYHQQSLEFQKQRWAQQKTIQEARLTSQQRSVADREAYNAQVEQSKAPVNALNNLKLMEQQNLNAGLDGLPAEAVYPAGQYAGSSYY